MKKRRVKRSFNKPKKDNSLLKLFISFVVIFGALFWFMSLFQYSSVHFSPAPSISYRCIDYGGNLDRWCYPGQYCVNGACTTTVPTTNYNCFNGPANYTQCNKDQNCVNGACV